MPIYNHQQIQNLEKYFRVNLINTVSGVRSAHLIGTTDANSNTNLAIFNSVVHIGANPPCLGFIMRPHVVERHTYENIKATNYFTINQVHAAIIEQAHQTSAKYPSDQSEFHKCNLTEEYVEDFPVPFVKKSRLKIGLSFVEEHPIKYNDTILIIGRIEKLIVPDEAVQDDGCIDHEGLETVVVSGLYSYYDLSFNRKLQFARP